MQHTQQSYPVGHLSTLYWLGLQKGDVHWTISSPGWAKHAWSCFFAPLNAQACVFIYNYARFNGPDILGTLVQHRVNTLCAPPTVWRMLIQEDLKAWPVQLRELISAGEPLNPEVIEQVRAAWGITIRDGYGQTETTAEHRAFEQHRAALAPQQVVLDRQVGAEQERGAAFDRWFEGAHAHRGEEQVALDARREQRVDRRRHLERREVRAHDPALALTLDRALVDQHAHQRHACRVGRTQDEGVAAWLGQQGGFVFSTGLTWGGRCLCCVAA